MQKLTATFIESFYTLKQEELLSSNFIEEIAMIEQLSTMNLTQDDSHYLENFIYKEIPKLQSIVNKTYSNDLLPYSQLNKNETVEDSLIEQIKIVKGNFKSFFIQVFDDEKFKIAANANLLNQRQQSFKSNVSTSVAPSLQMEEETFFKPIVMPTPQNLANSGQKILENNSGNWQDKFKRKSESLVNQLSESHVPSNSIHKEVEAQNNNLNKFELTPKIFSIIFVSALTIIAIVSSIF